MLLGNLFRDQLDRYGELETIADRWAAVVGAARRRPRAQRRRPAVADLGRDSRPHLLRRRGRLARAARAPARVGLQALPPLRPRLRLRRDLPRPPRPLPLPELRRRSGPSRASWPPTSSCAASAAPRSRCAGAARRAAAARPLQRLQRARRRGADAVARRRARRRRRRAGGASRRRSGAPRRSTSAAPRRSCWSRTRPAPTRCCARWRSRAASSTSSACSTTASPTAATSPGCGTPTGSCSSPHVRRMTCAGTRAAELALRLKYAGVPTDRIHVVDDARAARSTPRWPTARARCTSSPPTRRCSSCASCSPAAAQAKAYWR